MSDDIDDPDDNVDALLERKGLTLKVDSPKEEIMKVAFILDRVPSYILVISRVFPTAAVETEKETKTERDAAEVAQDEAGPTSQKEESPK